MSKESGIEREMSEEKQKGEASKDKENGAEERERGSERGSEGVREAGRGREAAMGKDGGGRGGGGKVVKALAEYLQASSQVGYTSYANGS